jgi:hypothetical protein
MFGLRCPLKYRTAIEPTWMPCLFSASSGHSFVISTCSGDTHHVAQYPDSKIKIKASTTVVDRPNRGRTMLTRLTDQDSPTVTAHMTKEHFPVTFHDSKITTVSRRKNSRNLTKSGVTSHVQSLKLAIRTAASSMDQGSSLYRCGPPAYYPTETLSVFTHGSQLGSDILLSSHLIEFPDAMHQATQFACFCQSDRLYGSPGSRYLYSSASTSASPSMTAASMITSSIPKVFDRSQLQIIKILHIGFISGNDIISLSVVICSSLPEEFSHSRISSKSGTLTRASVGHLSRNEFGLPGLSAVRTVSTEVSIDRDLRRTLADFIASRRRPRAVPRAPPPSPPVPCFQIFRVTLTPNAMIADASPEHRLVEVRLSSLHPLVVEGSADAILIGYAYLSRTMRGQVPLTSDAVSRPTDTDVAIQEFREAFATIYTHLDSIGAPLPITSDLDSLVSMIEPNELSALVSSFDDFIFSASPSAIIVPSQTNLVARLIHFGAITEKEAESIIEDFPFLAAPAISLTSTTEDGSAPLSIGYVVTGQLSPANISSLTRAERSATSGCIKLVGSVFWDNTELKLRISEVTCCRRKISYKFI